MQVRLLALLGVYHYTVVWLRNGARGLLVELCESNT